MTSSHPTHRRWCCASAVALCLFAGNAWAQDAAVLVEKLHRVDASNALDDPLLKPWHLKIGFQLFDEKGVATEKGTVEEWWKAPSMHKTVYTSPSYTSTEIHTKDGIYRSKGASSAPYLLEWVLRQTVHPMPDEKDLAEAKPEAQKQTLGKVPLDCIMLAQEIKHLSHAPLGLFATYCFDRNFDSLRLVYDFGSQLT